MTHIVEQFDANLAHKAMKIDIEKLWDHCSETYAVKSN